MPVDLEELPTLDAPTTTADDAPVTDAPAGDEPSTPDAPSDPLTEGLTEPDDVPALVPDEQAQETAELTKQGWTTDQDGRWVTKDGQFAPRQPSKAAAESARAEIARRTQLETWKAEGRDSHGNAPWRPNIYGEVKEILPGALQNPKGDIWIPAQYAGQATALLARGSKWGEVQQTRQQMAKEREVNESRTQFYAEQFEQILKTTLLDPDWMERATKDAFTYETAKQQVETRLRSAMVDAKDKFGAPRAKTEATGVVAEPLDPYDGRGAVDDFLNELSASPEFQGLDKSAVIAALTRENAEIFRHHATDGWLLDERPIRLVAQNVMLSKAASTGRSAVDPATNRNKAALPARPAAKPAAAPARPKATTTPKDPKTDPRYADEPWKNPALSFDERREAWYRGNNMRVPQ